MARSSIFPTSFIQHASGATLMMLMLLTGGCMGTPKVVESWKDPSVTGPLRFKKIVVIAFHPHARTRQAAEGELVRQIGADRAISGDQFLTDADRTDPEKIKALVERNRRHDHRRKRT